MSEESALGGVAVARRVLTRPGPPVLELGLATQVVTQDELAGAVDELARRLAAGPTVAYGSIRQAVAYSASHPLEESLAFEAEKMGLTGGTEDHLAAVNAFVAKEKPVFHGR